MSLTIAKQKACKAIGMEFYVTKKGIRQKFNLWGIKYDYKVIATEKEIIVEDSNGKRKKTKRKASVPRKVRNSSNEETCSGTERTGGEQPSGE